VKQQGCRQFQILNHEARKEHEEIHFNQITDAWDLPSRYSNLTPTNVFHTAGTFIEITATSPRAPGTLVALRVLGVSVVLFHVKQLSQRNSI
jgi:hypothetical protein